MSVRDTIYFCLRLVRLIREADGLDVGVLVQGHRLGDLNHGDVVVQRGGELGVENHTGEMQQVFVG